MSCEPSPWTQRQVSQRHENSAGGNNARAILGKSQIFQDLGTIDYQIGNIITYQDNGSDVIAYGYRQSNVVHLKANFENGSSHFSKSYPTVSSGPSAKLQASQSKGWIFLLNGNSNYVFNAADGTLLGELSYNISEVYEANNPANDVIVSSFEEIGSSGNYQYNFYNLTYDLGTSSFVRTLLWSIAQSPLAYESTTDNLLFPLVGESRELLTGRVCYTFPSVKTVPALEGGFDSNGDAYYPFVEETQIGTVGTNPPGQGIGERLKFRKLSFPAKDPNLSLSATVSWSVDLTQSPGGTLWGETSSKDVEERSEVINDQTYYYTGYMHPRGVSITNDSIIFLMKKLTFGYLADSGGTQFGDPSQSFGDYYRVYNHHYEVMTLGKSDGATLSSTPIQGISEPDNTVGGLRFFSADNEVIPWSFMSYSEDEYESETPFSSLAVIQGSHVEQRLLQWVEIDDGQSPPYWEIPSSPYPYNRFRPFCVLGGGIYYPNVEAGGNHTVRRLGTIGSCDETSRYCTGFRSNDPCYPRGYSSFLGDSRFPINTGTELRLEYNGCHFQSLPASMGYGWQLDAFHKIVEDTNSGALEYRDGNGGFERWDKLNDDFIPAHADNYGKAAKNQDGTYTLTFPGYNKLDFDEHGKLTRITDRSEFYIDYNYETVSPGDEDRARLTSMVDMTGMTTELVYATSSLLDRQPTEIRKKSRGVDPDQVTTLSYDSVTDRLESVTLPNGDKTEFFYHTNGRLSKVVEPGGRVPLEYTFHPDGKVHTETTYGIQKRTYVYDEDNNKVTVTTSDEETQAPDTPSPDQVVTYTYDQFFNTVAIEQTVDGSIVNTTQKVYGDNRNPYLVTEVVAPNLSVTKWKYNDRGNVIESTDALGVVTTYEYAEDIGPSGDQYLDLIRKIHIPAAGTTPTTTTEMVYNARGQLIEVIDPNSESSTIDYKNTNAGYQADFTTDRNGNKVTYDYDTDGRVDEIRVETGRTSGDLVSTIEYDGFDNVVTSEVGTGSATVIKSDMVYDSLNRLTEASLSSLGIQSNFEFENGLLKKALSPSNQASVSLARETVFNYDNAGRATSVSRSFQSQSNHLERVRYTFDGLSQLREMTRTKTGGGSTDQIFKYTYDALGRMKTAEDPLQKQSSINYEPYCTGMAANSARGHRVRTSYDVLCRPTEIETGDPTTSDLDIINSRELRQFEYDDRGRLVSTMQGESEVFGEHLYNSAKYDEPSLTSTTGGQRTYEYNNLDRLVKVTFEDAKTIEYEYDLVGNLTKVTENASFGSGSTDTNVTEYEYFKDNLTKKIKLIRASVTVAEFDYSYDEIGRLTGILYPAATGLEAVLTWDDASRLTSLTYKKGGTNVRAFTYQYDKSGNRTQTIETAGGTTLVQDYEYDWLDRLVKVKEGPTITTTTDKVMYTYDSLDNATKISLSALNLDFDFTYNIDDSLATRTKNDTTTGPPTLIFSETFTSDDDGNLTTRVRTENSDTYTTNYQWDDFDKLIAVSSSLNGVPNTDLKQDNVYGINGLRRKKTKKSGEEVTEYAEGLATAVAKSQAQTFSYLQAHQIVGFELNGAFYYFLHDALGSVRDIYGYNSTTSQWEVVQAYRYDERGNHEIAPMGGGPSSPKNFVGGMSVNDDTGDSGLYLMGHRFFEPSLGRFLSRDPIGHAGGLNLYSYANNSPATLTDHTGLMPVMEAPIIEGGTEFFTGLLLSPEPSPAGEALMISGATKVLFGLGVLGANAAAGKMISAGGGIDDSDEPPYLARQMEHFASIDTPQMAAGRKLRAEGLSKGRRRHLNRIMKHECDKDDKHFLRYGNAWEYAPKLDKESKDAQRVGVGILRAKVHGVSVTSGKPTRPEPRKGSALKLRSHFGVVYTPTGNDPYHHTVLLPDSVTRPDATVFNRIFGRLP